MNCLKNVCKFETLVMDDKSYFKQKYFTANNSRSNNVCCLY